MTEREMIKEAQDIHKVLLIRFPRYVEYLDDVTFKVNRRLTNTAGRANAGRGTVEISSKIFSDPENRHGFRNTVLHELAHILADRLWETRCKHGPKWKRVFMQIGGNGERCHSYKTKSTRSQHTIKLNCCGREVQVGAVRFRKWRNGTQYFCSKNACGQAPKRSFRRRREPREPGLGFLIIPRA